MADSSLRGAKRSAIPKGSGTVPTLKKRRVRCTGSEYGLHRYKDAVTQKWKPYKPGESPPKVKKYADSRIHRFGRERGFKCASKEGLDAFGAEIVDELNNMVRNPNSEEQRVTDQGMFENFVLKQFPNDAYTEFLKKIEDPDSIPKDEQIDILAPNNLQVCAWLLHMGMPASKLYAGLACRGNKYNSVRTRLTALSSTMLEMGGPKYMPDHNTLKALADMKNVSTTKRASVLEIHEDLPRLYQTVFGRNSYMNRKYDQVKLWARLLVQLAVISRASEVCTDTGMEYCPRMENVEFPTAKQDYLEDGYPRFVILSWSKWKHRTEASIQKGEHYRIRLFGNHKDLRFCPIHWLLQHWKLRGKAKCQPDDFIFDKCTSRTWRKTLKKLGENVPGGDFPDLTSHSLRRTGAQWARRCGADLTIIANVGRWHTYKNLNLYIQDADRRAADAKEYNDGVDPVVAFWTFDTKTALDCTACTDVNK